MNWFQTENKINTEMSSQLYAGLPTEADGIDLRIEMNRILYGGPSSKPLGHWVVIRSYDRNKTTPFFNPVTKEGVGGPQHPFTDTLVRVRHMPAPRKDTGKPVKAGDVYGDQATYFMEYNVDIKLGDQIYELNIADHKFKPTTFSFYEKYDVKRVQPYRLENGNVQFLTIVADYSNITY